VQRGPRGIIRYHVQDDLKRIREKTGEERSMKFAYDESSS
jgi:hypothetical protein